MRIIPYIIIGILFIYFIYSIYKIYKYKKERNKYIEDWKQIAEKEFEDNFVTRKTALNNEITQSQDTLNSIKKEIEEKKDFNSSLLKIREEELNRLIKEKEEIAFQNIAREVEDWEHSAQEAASFRQEQIIDKYSKDIVNKNKELNNICSEIAEYKSIREALNQEILRARAVEENQYFYCIQIPDSSKHDLAIINEIRNEFSKIDILDKLLYDNYIKKPVDEMIKRVIPNGTPSGIYKITRLKTGEVYIGRSTDVKSRWQQHCKSCYHCGTISHSKLHDTMQKDGIWNFTFELLEEVPKDKLNEREKYWINFYDSKTYGLNERAGG